MSRIYINSDQKKIVILSYAGGTKYFRYLSDSNTIPYTLANGNDLQLLHKTYDVLQIVREPISRYMSWFDKQFVKPAFKLTTGVNFKDWVASKYTVEWFDNYFNEAEYTIHYDGHTNLQSIWPVIQFKKTLKADWNYLKMEDIDRYFLEKDAFTPVRDPKEYIGVWDIIDPNIKDHAVSCIQRMYKPDIEWYNNLTFI
jgi:hypothetical protein